MPVTATTDDHSTPSSSDRVADPTLAERRRFSYASAANLAGWYGTAAVLGAYILVSFGLSPDGLAYQLLNLSGAGALGWMSLARKIRQSVVINAVWAVVAIAAIARIAV